MSDVTSGTIGEHRGERARHVVCANCDTVLTGRFCHHCGQPAHVHRSLAHVVEEFLHGLFHFENRIWRTLAELVWRPGRMIHDYIHGRRARYVPPLPLFLFMMAALFLVFSMTTHLGDAVETTRPGAAATSQAGAASASQGNSATRKSWLAALIKGTRPLGEDEVHRELMANVPWAARPVFEHKILHAANNRELAVYKIKSAAPKFAIILVPLTLPLLWMMFVGRRDVRLFDHVVFSFYSLSAMAMLLIVLAVLDAIGLPMVGEGLKVLLPPVMFYMQLHGAYQLTRWGTLWRTGVLLAYAILATGAYLLFVFAAGM